MKKNVQIYIYNQRQSEVVQQQLFRLGYRWNVSADKIINDCVKHWIFIRYDKENQKIQPLIFNKERHEDLEVVDLDFLFSDFAPDQYLGLTSQYDVDFDWEHHQFRIGCITIEFQALDELYKVIQEYRIK